MPSRRLSPSLTALLCPNQPVECVQELGAFLDRSAREQRGSAINAVAVGRVGQCQHQRRGTQLEVHLADLQHLQVEPLDEHIGRNSWLTTLLPHLEGMARKQICELLECAVENNGTPRDLDYDCSQD